MCISPNATQNQRASALRLNAEGILDTAAYPGTRVVATLLYRSTRDGDSPCVEDVREVRLQCDRLVQDSYVANPLHIPTNQGQNRTSRQTRCASFLEGTVMSHCLVTKKRL